MMRRKKNIARWVIGIILCDTSVESLSAPCAIRLRSGLVGFEDLRQLSAFRAARIRCRNLPIMIVEPPPNVGLTLRPARGNVLPLFLPAQRCQVEQ
jgi:hypothetical protein